MDITNEILAAYHAYAKLLGKFDLESLLDVAIGLPISDEARGVLENIVRENFARDEFAGFVRIDSVTIPLQLWLYRNGVKI